MKGEGRERRGVWKAKSDPGSQHKVPGAFRSIVLHIRHCPLPCLYLGLGFEVSVKQLVFSSSRVENALGSLHRLSARSRATSSEAT
jgi:hypothetical protein